jgi:hypothetical protein
MCVIRLQASGLALTDVEPEAGSPELGAYMSHARADVYVTSAAFSVSS